MQRVKVKFCGLRSLADVAAAAAVRADAVGFVFVSKSPRYVTVAEAKPLAAVAAAAGMQTVALFANQPADLVSEVVTALAPDVLQFHADEPAAFCEQFGLPYWKAIPMLATTDYAAYMRQHPAAAAYLLDAFGTGQSGGSGQVFEWFEFPQEHRSKLILAGGLQVENIDAAITATGAQFVDTSSGIESSPGVKSKAKMQAFMAAIAAGNCHDNNNKKPIKS